MAESPLSSGVIDSDCEESLGPLNPNLPPLNEYYESAENDVVSVMHAPHVQKLIPKRICGWDFVSSEDLADLQRMCYKSQMLGGCRACLEDVPGDDGSWMLKVYVSSERDFPACARQIRKWIVHMHCLYNAKLLWSTGKETSARLDASAQLGCVVSAVRDYVMLMPEKGLSVAEPLRKGVESGGVLLRLVDGFPCSDRHKFMIRKAKCAKEGRALELRFLQPDMSLTEKEISDLAPKRKSPLPVAVARKVSKENALPSSENTIANKDEKGKRGTTKKQRNAPQEGPNWYIEFSAKMKQVAGIEFKNGAGIPIQSVLGSMWTKHKAISECGTTCDEKCPCWKMMAELGAGVIQDKKQDPKWTNPLKVGKDAFPVGFMNRFSPKFYDLLEEKYPRETPAKYLSRLVELWKKHESNRSFGLTCRKNCDCENLWYVLNADETMKGDGKKKKRKSDPIPKKKRAVATKVETSKRAASQHSNTENKAKKLKRSQRLTDFGDTVKPSSREPDSYNKQKVLQKKAPPPRVPKSESLPDLSVSHVTLSTAEGRDDEKFSVTFSSERIRDQPLPYFFCTESIDTFTMCKVSSVAPGAGVEDSRIKKGTIVEAAEVEGTRRRVNGHSDLRKFYFEAKHLGRDLVLHFVNRKALLQDEEMIDQLQGYNQEWSEHGRWIGAEDESGWAGGALAMNKQSKNRRSSPQKAVFISSAMNHLEGGDWTKEDLMRPVCLTNPKPIVKGSRRESRPSKIRFSERNQKRLYHKDSATSEFLVKAEDNRTKPAVMPTAENTPWLAAKQREDYIRHLVEENGNLLKVVKALEERYACEITSYETLNEFRRLIKDKQHERDFQMKYKLLTIYLNALDVNRNARALVHWTRVQIVLDEIELQFNHNMNVDGANAQFMAFVKISKGNASHDILKSMPFSGDGVVHFPPDPMHFSFNSALEPLKSFEIEVKQLHFETGKYDKFVGASEALVKDFVVICKEPQKQYKMKRPISRHFDHIHGKKGWLAKAIVTMNVSCVPDEKLRVENRQPLCHQLNDITDWVQRFNKDLTTQERIESMLSVEVPVNHSTLLATAVRLGEQNLVSKLIDRGALVSVKIQKLSEELALIEDALSKNRRRIAMIIKEKSAIKGEV